MNIQINLLLGKIYYININTFFYFACVGSSSQGLQLILIVANRENTVVQCSWHGCRLLATRNTESHQDASGAGRSGKGEDCISEIRLKACLACAPEL